MPAGIEEQLHNNFIRASYGDASIKQSYSIPEIPPHKYCFLLYKKLSKPLTEREFRDRVKSSINFTEK